ncbi:hypothetical protein [Bacteriovorax sp. BSW11_IV]|uniref:hypothetical protein n=1 Tax=Bacteriovorax sp. BSW11_IV TaxID=1353529 RepID=UPI0009DC3992|nr:hypothetical protein [Bacteriovorax sp. BSW11_IV]
MKRTLPLHVLFCLVLSFSFFGCVGKDTNMEIPGVKGPNVTLSEDNVMISMVMENLQLEGGVRFRIPKFNDSYLEISPDLQSDGTLLSFSVSLDDVLDRNLNLDPVTLPGGRALPGVSGGKLPAVAFSVEGLENMRFYLGPKVFGIWVPVDGLNMEGGILTTRFHAGGNRVGNLSLVGKDENLENSGLLLLLDISGKMEKRLKRIQKRY